MTENRDDGFDLAVVGAGSAGFSAAIRAADLGARVALIGDGVIGGTCVNVGCVPSKTLIRATGAVHDARRAARFAGVRAEAAVADWAALVAQKDALVAELRQAKYIGLLPAYPAIRYIEGRARLTADGIAVGGRTIRAPKVVIATGAAPALPAIPGIETVGALTSTEALSLARLPRSMLVVGGGYVGCELAQMFARAGVAVTLLTRRRLLPDADPEVAGALAGYLRDEGIEVRTGLSYRRVAKGGAGVTLALAPAGEGDGGEEGEETEIAAETLLAATGRRPNSAGLGLDDLGVARDERGFVAIDEHMRTSRPGIYAAGDVTGRDMFVYMAAYGAKLAAENALAGDRRRYDSRAMPWVVFTDPQLAGVGVTETQARARGIDVRTATLPLEALPRALAARDPRGLVKLVAEAATGRLLGAQILAPEGADAIQAAAFAIKAGMTAAEVGESLFPYLTTVEGLKLAAQSFDKDVSRLSCCAG